MEEIWKDIPDYEGLYQISNLGRVKSLERKLKNFYNCYYHKEQILKLCVNKKTGYVYVCLNKNNKGKVMVVHKLIAETFLNKQEFKSMPDEDRTLINLDDLEVNHKDENKQNNNVNNLEWCTHLYNVNYGTRNSKLYNRTSFKKGHKPKTCKKVEKYSFDGELLGTYYSIREAGRKNNFSASSIYNCCEGKIKCRNYVWKYADK